MFRSIWEDIKREFNYGNMVTRLVIVNAAVFVLINLVRVILIISSNYGSSSIFGDVMAFLAMSSDWFEVLIHPWSIITSMFLHEGFWHILFNMLLFYWFGRILGDLLGDHRILPLYLMAGLAGNAAYFISANLLSYMSSEGGIAYGASGAVMGVVMATAVLVPERSIRLLFLGNVRLKYIAGALLLIDIFGIGTLENTGGHFAHLGGALFGWFFIRRLQSGDDFSAPVNNMLHKIQEFFRGLGERTNKRSERGPRVAYRNPNKPQEKKSPATSRFSRHSGGKKAASPSLSHEERVDAILEKIKESGYEQLTEEEKKYLFNASKK